MLGISIKSVWSHKRRLAGALLAVVFGVAFLSGTLLLGDTLRANFDSLFMQANGNTDVVVRSATQVSDSLGQSNRATVNASVVTDVERVDGVAVAVPYVEGYGQLLGRDGNKIGGAGPPTRAANWITVPSLNPYNVVEGRAPATDDEVVINRGAAKTGDLHLGDTTTLYTPQARSVRIVGISTFGSADGFGPSTFTGLTLDAAQTRTHRQPEPPHRDQGRGRPGCVTPGSGEPAQRGPASNVQAITGTELAAENYAQVDSGFLGVVRNGLVAFAVIALLVAAFSIFNTFSILVTQRSRESRLLRALGATRRQIIYDQCDRDTPRSGRRFRRGLVRRGRSRRPAQGGVRLVRIRPSRRRVGLQADERLIVLVAGVVATFLAGVLPSVRGSRVPPVAALRDLEIEPPVVTRRRTVVGVAIAGSGAGIGHWRGAGPQRRTRGARCGDMPRRRGGARPGGARPAAVALGRPIARHVASPAAWPARMRCDIRGGPRPQPPRSWSV